MINDATPSDTFIDTTGWGKGMATVNGHILGKYWASQGPQVCNSCELNLWKLFSR